MRLYPLEKHKQIMGQCTILGMKTWTLYHWPINKLFNSTNWHS